MLRFNTRDKVSHKIHGKCIVYAAKHDSYMRGRLSEGSLKDHDYAIHKWPTEEETPELFKVLDGELELI
ncbi:MAG: hypothetical protein ACXVNM_01525 [Bacteroidia bacterium]